MKKRRVSIALMLSVAIVAVVTLLLGAFAGVAMTAERNERWARLKDDVAMSADQQAVALSLPLWNLDPAPIQSILRSGMRNRQIQSITLASPTVNLTLSRDADWRVTAGAVAPAAAGWLAERRRIERDGEHLGDIVVLATPRFLEQDLSARRISIVVFVLGLDAALVLSLYVLLWQLMLKPLKEIERFAAAVTEEGKGSFDLGHGRFLGELATLRESLQDMLAMLERRYLALRDSEERLKLATTAGSIGIWDWDIEKDELVWNDQMYLQYGVLRENFGGAFEAWASTLAPAALNEATLAIKAALSGDREFASEFTIRRPDGRVRIIKADSTTLRDDGGRAVRMVGVNLDITERKEAEDAVKTMNAELERRVRERTVQLEEAMTQLTSARDSAESATRAKSEFLANMSHEIRTPMNAVVGMTHLALRTDMTTRQRGYLSKAKIAADSLLLIINDILDFSKIEAGKLEMEMRPFLLQDVLDKVTSVVGLKANEKALELLLKIGRDVPAELVGDTLRLEQVLINLCSNAVKFTARGEVIVTVETVSTEGDGTGRTELRFVVRDTGIGMSERQVQSLFQPFNQLDPSTTRQYGGTGLGLAICKKLVELMGGTIQARSARGEGSEFSFTVLFGAASTSAARSASAVQLARQAIRDMRVLVIDDSPNSRDVLSGLLHDLGLRPALSSSGEEGLEILARAEYTRRYDLVLLDWKMPGLDGIETAQRIRAMHSAGRAPRIVLVTAYGDDELARRAVAEGIDGCLAKPVSASALLDTILAIAADGSPRPPSPAPSMPASAASQAPRGLAGHRILLVEDNEFNQIIATELLGDVAGMHVTLAENGHEALEHLQAAPFDVVLMDVQMPVMDGYRATASIRAQSEFANLPIIAMTAHAMAGYREKCLAAGMNDYVTKPFEPADLFAVLLKWMPDADPGQSSIDPPAMPAPVAGISFELGLRRCLGRTELYARVLRRFRQTRLADAHVMRAAIAANDLALAASTAHSVISTAGAIGAQALSEAARKLEDALRTRADVRIPDLLDTFSRCHAQVLDDLHRHIESMAPG